MMPSPGWTSRSSEPSVVSPSPAADLSLSSVAPSREALSPSLGSSPSLVFPDESAPAALPLVPALDTLSAGRRGSDGGNEWERSGTHSSHSPSAVNPLRSMNPAFSLSPRTASSSGMLRVSSTPTVRIRTDRERPPAEHRYAVGKVDDRRHFLADCAHLARRMSSGRILEELLPAMLMTANYEDSVLAIAERLPEVVRQTEAHKMSVLAHFMGLIMQLCCNADHAVVQQMALALVQLLPHVGDETAAALLLPFVMSMRVSFWSSPRAVAAGVLGVFAARLPLVEASGMCAMEWFQAFIELARDECHFVREMAVGALHQWVKVAEVHHVQLAEMPLPLVHECMTDERSDAVRYTNAMELPRLAECIGREATAKYLQLPFITAAKDPSWRVRYAAARHLGAFAKHSARPEDLLNVFIQICADEEHEVRAMAAEQIGALIHAAHATPETWQQMSQLTATLVKDREPVVRESVANQLHVLLNPSVALTYSSELRHNLVALLTDEDFVVSRCAIRSLRRVVTILCHCIHQKKEENGRAQDAHRTPSQRRGKGRPKRGALPSNTSSRSSSAAQPNMESSEATSPTTVAAPVEGVTGKGENRETLRTRCAADILSSILDHLHIISDSANWRVREETVVALRHLGGIFTQEEFMPLTYIIRSLLRDPVSVVRQRACETLAVVATAFGPEWAAVMTFDLLRKEFAMDKPVPFVWRLVAIHCLSGIVPVVNGLAPNDLRRHELVNQWMRMVVTFSQDPVSNVRLALTKSMTERLDWYTGCTDQRELIRKCIERLQSDKDVDVSRVAATMELAKIGGTAEPF